MEQLEVLNPATNEVIERLNYTSHEEISAQIEGAFESFQQWKQVDAHERSAKLYKWAALIDSHQDEIARLITLEGGKPLAEAQGEVAYANSYVKWYAEEAKRIYGRTIPANTPSKKIVVDKFPVGVVGAITPWNFPAAMITRKMAPALAAGCTIICKPAVKTPLTTIKLVELAHEAGIPKHAISYIIASGKDAGDIFTEHDQINKITFTGSTEVGKTLIEQSAKTVKNVTMELGGLAPFIVHNDADIDAAVDGTIASKFRNAGQTCICANRIFVHRDIVEQYTERLVKKVHALSIGDGLKDDVKIGPLIDNNAVDKVLTHITDAQEKGGKLSRSLDEIQALGGNFLKPVVISNVDLDMKVMHEETFGPVAPIMAYDHLDEVIRIANDTEFGLASYFFTNNYRTGIKLFNELDYGVIGWNDGGPSAAHAPFGGLKQSGYGREGGTEGIEPYLETKYLSIETDE
ncbi:MAG TPA: NAD-dependent succinate-semialdehyde dehydrogenase [Staphylococcus sp.]|nr:NAD-dependent succinate-semialdehyde dehydrogenase [Staphylococcus sp.]